MRAVASWMAIVLLGCASPPVTDDARAEDVPGLEVAIVDAVDVVDAGIDAPGDVISPDVVDARDVMPTDAARDAADIVDAPACPFPLVAPYYGCVDDCQCGPNAACVALAAGSMPRACLPSCTMRSDCPLLPGSDTMPLVTPVCAGTATDHRCHLSGCALTASTPRCPSDLRCVGVSSTSTSGECQP